MADRLEDFQKLRAELNEEILACGHLGMKRFFALDHQAYEPGPLGTKTKELLGLVASAVLRCDDCITYHLVRCGEEGWKRDEVIDALNVALIGGGSITIPHVGRVPCTATILRPAAKLKTSVDDKTRELGALIVVNGGRYQPDNGPLAAAQLFVGAKRICVRDARFQTLLVIPVNEIAVAHAEESETGWLVRVTWADQPAEFSYRGIFAEHLARVAEPTLHGVIHPSLPLLPQHPPPTPS